MLYNGGGQTTGLMWDPSKSTAKVELISNLQDHSFQGTTLKGRNLRYTADPAVAQTLLTADSTGCLGFTRATSKDTPQFLSIYGGLPQESYANQFPTAYDQIITIKYTSGGKTYTITTHG